MTRDCGRELAVTPAFTGHALLALLLICSLGQACSADLRLSEKQTVPQWSISSDPTLVIGTEGDPHYEFFRIVDVAALPNAGLVVAEGGNQELRVFSGAGEFLRTFGGSGDGPGEFRNLARVATRGDTILALGQAFRAAAQLRVFHAEQGLLWGATVRPENESGAVTPANILSSRALLVIRGGWRAATAPPEGTVVRDTLTLGIERKGISDGELAGGIPQPILVLLRSRARRRGAANHGPLHTGCVAGDWRIRRQDLVG
jgi:hypothetical protein